MNFCKDCNHHRMDHGTGDFPYINYRCSRMCRQEKTIDPVTGNTYTLFHGEMPRCQHERENLSGCGPDGKYFECIKN